MSDKTERDPRKQPIVGDVIQKGLMDGIRGTSGNGSLERQGKRFLVDFGYENAPGMVWFEIDLAIYDREEQEAERRRG